MAVIMAHSVRLKRERWDSGEISKQSIVANEFVRADCGCRAEVKYEGTKGSERHVRLLLGSRETVFI